MNRFFSSDLNDLFSRLNQFTGTAPYNLNRSTRRFFGPLLYSIKSLLARILYPVLAHLFEHQADFNSRVVQALNKMRESCADQAKDSDQSYLELEKSFGERLQFLDESIAAVNKDFLQQNHNRYTENKNLESTVLAFNHDRFWEHRQLEHVLNSQLLDIRTELGNITFTFLHLQKSYEHLAAVDQKIQQGLQELSEKMDVALAGQRTELEKYRKELDGLTRSVRALIDGRESGIVGDLNVLLNDQQVSTQEAVSGIHQSLNVQLESTEEAIRTLQSALGARLMVTEEAIRNLQTRSHEYTESIRSLQGLVSSLRKVLMTRDKKKKTVPIGPPVMELVHPSDASRSMITEMAVFDLSERFRGSEEDVLERQRHYLKYLKGRNPVLDVGCGRGEMLHLLSGNGTEAVGVDSNQLMVDYCKSSGLNAVYADAISYLSAGNGSPYGAIYAAHFVEHLLPDQLLQFLSLSGERLKNNGVLILETPNPVGLFNMGASFYLDPSHIRPLHPEALKMLLESMGFRILELQYLSPWPEEIMLRKLETNGHQLDKSFQEIEKNFERINEILFAPRDYSIVAEK
jgi:2-polyprenyl-3-methyl-5-hydroxy-6-metoxy-1,4-benzoquinol methylase